MRPVLVLALCLVGAVAAGWLVFERTREGAWQDRAEALARRETLQRERSYWRGRVEVRAVDCERRGGEFACQVAINFPRPSGGETFVRLAVHNDSRLVVRDYKAPRVLRQSQGS